MRANKIVKLQASSDLHPKNQITLRAIKYMFRVFAFLVLLVLGGFATATQLSANYLDGLPNTIKIENDRFTGAMGKLINCTIESAELDSSFAPENINKLLDQLATAEVDFSTAIVRTDERDQYATPTSPILTLEAILLSMEPQESNRVGGQVVAVARGSSYSERLTQQGARIKYAESYVDAIQMLIDQQVTAALVPRAVINANDISEAERFYSSVFAEDEIVFYVSKQSKNYQLVLDQLNHGLNICQAK